MVDDQAATARYGPNKDLGLCKVEMDDDIE